MGPSSFRSLVLQASFPWLALRAQPHRSLRVSSTNFVPPPSPIRMQLPANIGFRHWQLAHPLHTPYGASLSFVRFTHLRLLPHSPSRASQRLASLWSSRGPPQHCTCLLGVGFPLPGPQVWICTSCLLNMPDTLLAIPTGIAVLCPLQLTQIDPFLPDNDFPNRPSASALQHDWLRLGGLPQGDVCFRSTGRWIHSHDAFLKHGRS